MYSETSMTLGLSGLWRRSSPRVVITALIDAPSRDMATYAQHRVDAMTSAVRYCPTQIVADVALYQKGNPHEPALRHYVIDERAVRRQWPRPCQVKSQAAPSARELVSRLRANQKRWPGALHVLYVNGHGYAYRQLAGMKPHELGAELQHAAPLPLAIIDACYEGNLEAMSVFPHQVQTVVAAQTRLTDRLQLDDSVQTVTQLPLERMLLRLAASPHEDSTVLARHMIEEAARVPDSGQCVAAYDMRALREELLPSLDALGRALPLDASKRARQATPVYEDGGLVDLADLLERAATDAPSQAAAAHAALAHAVIARDSSPELAHLSGLSVQASPQTVFEDVERLERNGHRADEFSQYDDTRLPAAWKGFVRHS
jgi:hypothetical protein